MGKTLEIVREYLKNPRVTLNELNQVRLEVPAQTLGHVFESEEEVTDHLRILCQDYGNEWNGIDAADLYNDPTSLNPGLRYLGDDIWLQYYR